MSIEIHKPELVQRLTARIQTGRFHNTDELIEKALDALDEKNGAPAVSASAQIEVPPMKDIEQLFAPLRGLNLDFSRNPSTGRPVDL